MHDEPPTTPRSALPGLLLWVVAGTVTALALGALVIRAAHVLAPLSGQG